MRSRTAVAASVLALLALASHNGGPLSAARISPPPDRAPGIRAESLTAVVQRYCVSCHNDRQLAGNLSLRTFDVAAATAKPEIAEKMVAKLRAEMMPPPGSRRPGRDTLLALVDTLEHQLDVAAAARPNPGSRTFQRLNRAEYAAAIRDLLGLEIDPGLYLPLDTKSDNFDNIADVQVLSPTLLDAYLRAASDISWLALGNPRATTTEVNYSVPRTASQSEHVEGAPFGTRGGVSVVHTFPADGSYVFTVSFYHETTGAFAGGNARNEQIEISIDGERVALLEIDRWMHASDPNGVSMATEAVRITAGPHRVSAAFIPPSFQGVAEDLVSPLKWSLNSTSNATAYGFSLLPHLREMAIHGPNAVTGVSDTPVRQKIFTCRPSAPPNARSCAESIVMRLGKQAFRRPLVSRDSSALMGLYDRAAATGGFESGVRTALAGILASPDFVFRFERAPETARAGESYPVSNVDLASRLSFFLWSAPPDRELLTSAQQGRLSGAALGRARARATSAAHARGSQSRSAGDAICRAVAAAPGPRENAARREAVPGFR
jgi:hypothetical protein